MPGFEAYYSNP